MGSEENYERMWAMKMENEQRLEELRQQQREREYLEELGQPQPERREWRLPTPEPPPRERGRDTSPIDWSSVIDQRIAAEHAFMFELLAYTIAEVRSQIEETMRKEFEAELKALSVEVCETKIRAAELRLGLGELREQVNGGRTTIDLPALPLRSSRAN